MARTQTQAQAQTHRQAHTDTHNRTADQQLRYPYWQQFPSQERQRERNGVGGGRGRAVDRELQRVGERVVAAAAAEGPSSIARHTEHFATLDRRRRSVRSFFFSIFPLGLVNICCPTPPTHCLLPPPPLARPLSVLLSHCHAHHDKRSLATKAASLATK